MKRIYLDHNATTPLRDEVLAAMLPVLRDGYGNPSSTHEEGAAARRCVEVARDQVARALGIPARGVLFTAGATEANNTALQSVVAAGADAHLVISEAEHPSVLEPARWLEAHSGVRVTRVGVDRDGQLDEAALERALADAPTLVALLWANNETGVIQAVEALAPRVKAFAGARFHVDATQLLGKRAIDLSALGVDSAACSAHKLGGPKGVGCLATLGEDWAPVLLHGGPQERRRRGGTENTAGIAGFGAACALVPLELPERAIRDAQLRDRLWDGLQSRVPKLRRNGRPEDVLPNTLNVEFEGLAGEILVQALDVEGVAASMGAACHSGSIDPSHVLAAMGRTPEQARGSLRFSVGHGVDEAQIDRAVELVAELCERVRKTAGVAR